MCDPLPLPEIPFKLQMTQFNSTPPGLLLPGPSSVSSPGTPTEPCCCNMLFPSRKTMCASFPPAVVCGWAVYRTRVTRSFVRRASPVPLPSCPTYLLPTRSPARNTGLFLPPKTLPPFFSAPRTLARTPLFYSARFLLLGDGGAAR